jgi:hypothetical protein
MAVADLYLTFGAALLPHTDVGGQLKPLTSLLAQVRRLRKQGRWPQQLMQLIQLAFSYVLLISRIASFS